MSEGSGDLRMELVCAGQLALERADRGEFRELVNQMMHPDGEWEPLLVGVEGGPYIGPQGVLTWFDDIEVTRDVGTVYEFDGDKVRRGRVYASRADAIAAAEAQAATSRSTDAGSVG